jgi:predicted phosphodiesterase
VAYLILSDIHSNLEALEAVIAGAEGSYDRILCLGDLVGYGADPNPIVDWARKHVEVIVRGNHDKACVGLDSLENYNLAAQKSAEWTRETLTPENAAYLTQLPRGPLPYIGRHDETPTTPFDLVHGSPMDEDEYLLSAADAWLLRPALATDLTFFGHTHVQGGFLVTRGGVKRIPPRGTLAVEPDHFFLINPGSVGQPRDSDPRAAYALYSPDDRTVTYRRAEYDVEKAAAKIAAAGLPDHLARRLFLGL